MVMLPLPEWEENKFYKLTENSEYVLMSEAEYGKINAYTAVYNFAKFSPYQSAPVFDSVEHGVYEASYQYDNFLHDIMIRDLGVEDTDPVNHAIGGSDGEETHGFDIQYCHRASVINCGIFNVGDEAIDMHACLDSHIERNNVVGSPGAGTKGGAISVGDGCNNVIIANNTVNGTICGEDRFNFGIAVEALNDTVKNILIKGNTITNVKGNGININSSSHGANLENIFVNGNIVTNPVDVEYMNARSGIVVMGSKPKSNIHISGNTIKNVGYGINVTETNVDGLLINDFSIDGCTIRGIGISSPEIIGAIISNGIIKNVGSTAISCASEKGQIKNIVINGVGINDTSTNAISATPSSEVTATNVTLLNCKNKTAIYGVHTIINAIVEQLEELRYVAISHATIIKGGKFNRGFGIIYTNGAIDGVLISTNNAMGQNAIEINTTGVKVINNTVLMASESTREISESTGADYNLISNNVTRKMIGKIGTNTIATNNIKLPS